MTKQINNLKRSFKKWARDTDEGGSWLKYMTKTLNLKKGNILRFNIQNVKSCSKNIFKDVTIPVQNYFIEFKYNFY